jgi:hypothetical protein
MLDTRPGSSAEEPASASARQWSSKLQALEFRLFLKPAASAARHFIERHHETHVPPVGNTILA